MTKPLQKPSALKILAGVCILALMFLFFLLFLFSPLISYWAYQEFDTPLWTLSIFCGIGPLIVLGVLIFAFNIKDTPAFGAHPHFNLVDSISKRLIFATLDGPNDTFLVNRYLLGSLQPVQKWRTLHIPSLLLFLTVTIPSLYSLSFSVSLILFQLNVEQFNLETVALHAVDNALKGLLVDALEAFDIELQPHPTESLYWSYADFVVRSIVGLSLGFIILQWFAVRRSDKYYALFVTQASREIFFKELMADVKRNIEINIATRPFRVPVFQGDIATWSSIVRGASADGTGPRQEEYRRLTSRAGLIGKIFDELYLPILDGSMPPSEALKKLSASDPPAP